MWQIDGSDRRHHHLRMVLDTIDSLDKGSKLIALNMAVKTTQAQIAGFDITIANERNRNTRL